MITIVDGKGVGAGKSYYVTTQVLRHLGHGGTIFYLDSYAPLFAQMKEYCAAKWGVEIEPDQLNPVSAEDAWRLHEITPPGTDDNPVLLILDEAQRGLNARDWNDPKKRALFDWACESRHDSNDLIFITQNWHNIDKQIARLATYVIRARNMLNFHIPGLGRFPFAFFLVCTFDPADQKYAQKREWLRHSKEIFGCYTSKSMRGAHKRQGEPIGRKKLKRTTRKGPMGKVLILFVIFGGLWSGYKIYGVVAGPSKPEVAAVSSSSPGGTMKSATPAPVAKSEPLWTIVTEKFRGRGADFLRTDLAHYTAGEMSSKGFVEKIEGKVARIRTPEAKLLYVVAEENGHVPELRATAPQLSEATPKVGKTIDDFVGAKWTPVPFEGTGKSFSK